MTGSLSTRATALRNRLMNLDRLGMNVQETRLLEDLRSELDASAHELLRRIGQARVLRDAGVDIPVPVSLDAVQKRAASLLDKFMAEKLASALKTGVGWTNLQKNIKTASDDVQDCLVKGWKAYRLEVFSGEAPSVIKGRIAFTQANENAFKLYEQIYGLYQSEADRIPIDRESIERVRELSRKLIETAKGFDFDVPTDVKRFLEAIQSGGAKLDMLTDVVREWLTNNNAVDSYCILPRSAHGRR